MEAGEPSRNKSLVICPHVKAGPVSLKELQKSDGGLGPLLSSTRPSPNILLGPFLEAPESKSEEDKGGGRCSVSQPWSTASK